MLNQSIAEKSTCINLSTDRWLDTAKGWWWSKGKFSCAKKDNSDWPKQYLQMGGGGVLLQESCATPLVPTTNWIFQENLRNCTYFFYIEIIFKGFKFPQILVLFTLLVLMEILVLKLLSIQNYPFVTIGKNYLFAQYFVHFCCLPVLSHYILKSLCFKEEDA